MSKINFSDNYANESSCYDKKTRKYSDLSECEGPNKKIIKHVTNRELKIAKKLESRLDKALTEQGRDKLKQESGLDHIDLGEKPLVYADNFQLITSLNSSSFNRLDISKNPTGDHPASVKMDAYEDFDSKKLDHIRNWTLRKTQIGGSIAFSLMLFKMRILLFPISAGKK